ncbi:hypothetical protein M430DRAFT_21281 [Amorphotheca resinae ATCC 22711]|uniref:Succinate--CoA ligase [ADP-forming] subunit beta, mitochondrial n=1 Tax=Amorphotheca resinae ATCC 22711 TaxID=857342 RepID=A0A2T3AU45_AMORE|nr:hypothetical protein M430DRAFT_21281 [Amorphotheca resinae ATCC 22711]PSS12174.1 hypothetical protein M430DRAFT_21281 [Amorphotheca resinae ATCC 22711]
MSIPSFRSLIARAHIPSHNVGRQQVRCLSIHEHHSQNLLKEFGIPVPRGSLAKTPHEVKEIVSSIGRTCFLKSQVLAGGRGKGSFDNGLRGGIQAVKNPEDGYSISEKMLGHHLMTQQTISEGLLVDKLYVTESVEHTDELYLAMTIDRARYCPAIILSKSGGVDIENIAKENPDQLHKYWFQLSSGITPELVSEISRDLDFTSVEKNNMERILKNLFELFVKKDATLLEINPLARTAAGEFVCLDAKFRFDDAAGKRQPELFALRDVTQEVDDEVAAEKFGLVYVRLDGNIGNVVNGAGLAMATNDAISLYGGRSANFLDAGGQATKETMQRAFEIILKDPRVNVILVNIYGGIIRCDMIAESIIAAAAQIGPLRVPLVVRLQGTNSEAGLKLIAESGLGLHTESGFGEAARKAVELARLA